jgi:hypothetical protein
LLLDEAERLKEQTPEDVQAVVAAGRFRLY